MKKSLLIIVALVVVAVGAYLVFKPKSTSNDANNTTNNSGTPAAQTTADPNTVTIKNMDFATKSLTVKKGTTVTWKNEDSASHTVTFDDSAMSSANSSLFANGETYKYTFDTAGTFAYHCTPHPFMKGTIVVTD